MGSLFKPDIPSIPPPPPPPPQKKKKPMKFSSKKKKKNTRVVTGTASLTIPLGSSYGGGSGLGTTK